MVDDASNTVVAVAAAAPAAAYWPVRYCMMHFLDFVR